MAVSEYYRGDILGESSYSVVKIPTHKVKQVWHLVEPLLDAGLKVAPELSFPYVIEGLRDESIQLWVVLLDRKYDSELTAAFLTSVERHRGEWVVSLYALAGCKAKEWLGECDRMMQAFALVEDAKRVRMCGRKAWQRLLPTSFRVTGMRGGHLIYERTVVGTKQ